MKATELLALFGRILRDKLAMRQRHVAVAKHVPPLRLQQHLPVHHRPRRRQLNWLSDAITDMGGAIDDLPGPDIHTSARAPKSDAL